MELPGGSKNKIVVCLYEAMGCGIIVTVVNTTANQAYQIPAIGLALTVAIILLGPISNAHCNPAVTLGVLIREMGEERSRNRRGENVLFAIMIWISQWIGAIIACLIILAVRSEDDKTGMAMLCGKVGYEGNTLKPTCGLDGNYYKMFLVEVIGTFLFVSVNVNIIYNNGSSEIILNAIIIGMALSLGIFIAAPTSGGAINPGVGLVQNIFQNIVNDIELK